VSKHSSAPVNVRNLIDSTLIPHKAFLRAKEGWLEAKAEIAGIIETEVLGKKRRSGKRVARYEHLDAPASAEVDTLPAEPPAIPEPGNEASKADDERPVGPPPEKPLARSIRPRPPASICRSSARAGPLPKTLNHNKEK
jgi:hypothetical protein